MASGLNGRQTGTVPKIKSKNNGSQSHRLARESLIRTTLSDWEPMTDLGNRSCPKKKSSMTHSEAETDFIKCDLGRSRSSTMTSHMENGEGSSTACDNILTKLNLPDRKQVVQRLSQIQSYIQQTAALMNSLKTSDSQAQRNQYEKLFIMLEDLKDSESKLSSLLNKIDNTESRIEILLTDLEEQEGNNNIDGDEEELVRNSEESKKKKLELLQKRKQDLLNLQEKAKKQLQEAQAEQSRLVARASSLNQELNSNKAMGLNVQQLNQRLKALQQMYSTHNQITDTLGVNQRDHDVRHVEEDQAEISDTETDFQLVADKMEEINAMKAQLGQIQKIMASINGIQTNEVTSTPRMSGDNVREQTNQNSQNSSFTDTDQNGEDVNNNGLKLEQAKSKLSQLTQLLEIVQSAQNATNFSPSYLQLVSNLVNDEVGSSIPSPTLAESVKSSKKNTEEIAVEAMQAMSRELEETTAAMKEERDRLFAARQELQDIARKIPINKQEGESMSLDDLSENEPPCLKPEILDAANRDLLNGSILNGAEQSPNCNENSLYICRAASTRNKHRGTWNSSATGSSSTNQERRLKNETLSRDSNQSSRGGSRALNRDQSRWSPSPSVSFYNERPNLAVQTQSQLEMSANLCEMMLSESFQKGIHTGDLSLQEMFAQHQLLTRTVAQCSQLLWMQQKQIIELRNAFMLQCGNFSNLQSQQISFNQNHLPVMSNSGSINRSFSNANHIPPGSFQQQQNFNSINQHLKLNSGDPPINQMPHQDFSEPFLHQTNQTSTHFIPPEIFGCEFRSGNFNRCNTPSSNTNQNINLNVSSGSNNRVPGGINCVGPEDSGALNNQVPPGNRANNYWDNFRSYSRQNLLSNTKSNEDTEISRRCHAISSQERLPRDNFSLFISSQNNQSGGGICPQASLNCGNLETGPVEPYLLPSNQNMRVNHHSQTTRSRSVEPQNARNPGKNESRHQDNDSRNLNSASKNEGAGSSSGRHQDGGSENFRSVRNDVNQSLRNVDNLNNSRNFVPLVRDFDNEEAPLGNNKKRLERTRSRNESVGNLNNRGHYKTSLWENISSEVSNLILANETRPHFLLQLFRDLQQVSTDSLRQRILETIEETVSANNLNERASNLNGGNVNIIENRNNIRGSRSNLNRNNSEDPTRIDELFCHLRENQNTIRQNIGISSFILGGNNLENPNISNIRELGTSRNNLESEGLRDLRTYFEANLCNFGHHSALENPNLSNIRENLTRRPPIVSELENVNPKNVYLSIYDNATIDSRRRNQELTQADFRSPFRIFESGNDYGNEILGNRETNFEGSSAGGRAHFQQDNRFSDPRFPILDRGDNFGRSRPYLGNGNDSGIDINFNNEERKRNFIEDVSVATNGITKTKKNESASDVEGAAALIHSHWDRNSREASFDSSLRLSRNDMSSPFIPICENSFFSCRTFQQLDNGDLAEADQSRNEETSGAESDNGFINAQIVDNEPSFNPDQNIQPLNNDFASQNIPESERSFLESQNCENDVDIDWGSTAEPEGFPNSASEPEGNFIRINDTCDNLPKDESFYQLNASTSSENNTLQSEVKHRKKIEEAAGRESYGDVKKLCKNSRNKIRDSSFNQVKFNGSEDFVNNKAQGDSVASVMDERQLTENREPSSYGAFQLALDKSAEADKGNTSPEADSDWENGCGLDQVPTRLKKSGSTKKSEDSEGSVS